MKIAILTEGGGKLGLGHISRCLALYEEIRKRGILPTFIINSNSSVDLIKKIPYIQLNWLEKQKELSTLLNGIDMTFVDSYLAHQSVYRKIARISKLSVFMDDVNRIAYPQGIVVNGNANANILRYPQNNKYLLGIGYLPLRNDFRTVKSKRISKEVRNILITFGGSDNKNITPIIQKVLCRLYPQINKKIVIGQSFQNIDEIMALADVKTEIIDNPAANKMKELMLEADISISAAGQTLYELVRMRVPTVVIKVAENQSGNVTGLKNAGLIEYTGSWDDKNLERKISESLEKIMHYPVRKYFAVNAKRIIDGRGASRTIDYCLKNYIDKFLIIRKAASKDSIKIFALSNEELIRNNSFNTRKILLPEHKKWFAEKLADNNYLFLVGELDNQIVAQLRYDIKGNNAFISIGVDCKYHGLDIGKTIMRKGIEYLKLSKPGVRHLIAYIKKNNHASKKFFQSAGFIRKKDVTFGKQKAYHYIFPIK